MSITQTTWTPRGLRAQEAALYIGIGKTKFFELVQSGKMPKPKRVDGCVVWDRFAIDAAFEGLGNDEETDNPWDDLCE